MLRKLNQGESISTSRFGGFCPYWVKINGEVYISDNFQEIITIVPIEDRKLDLVAVLELLQFNYILGDRTIVSHIYRMPWRATLFGNGKIVRKQPIPHKNITLDTDIIADQLIQLLEEELLHKTLNASKVYILLTGGLDSRIIAGLLKRIEKKISASIECVTWGLEDSRDVHYARRIAGWFDWKFTNISYSSELLWDNILRSAIWGGAQVSGLHLHNLAWFENVSKNDVVLTGLFGDSIGRAEFSSIHLLDLKLPKIYNTHNLINYVNKDLLYKIAEKDRAKAWHLDKSPFYWSKLELDMEENYMRRMLRHSFDYILNFCDVEHIFTSEKVVSFMWSLSPKCRTNDVYFRILRKLDPRLYSLPWARNGIAPDGTKEREVTLRTNYHDNFYWLTNDLKPKILELIDSDTFDQEKIFNPQQVKWIIKNLNKDLAENVTKLYAIELVKRTYQIKTYDNLDLIKQYLSTFIA